MKKFKLLYLLIAFVAAAFTTSCTEAEYTPGEAGQGAEVYFSNENATSYSLSDEDTSFDLILNRINGEEAQTVSVLSDIAAESASLFTIPNSVTFKAGETTAKLTIGVDIASLEDDTDYNIELLINDENNTTPYGLSSMSITVIRWPWELVGKGKMREDFFSSMFDCNKFVEVDVNIHEHKSQKGLYMLENPWGPNTMGALFDMTLAEVEAAGYCIPTNVIIDCTDPNDVFFPLQDVGVNVNDAYGWIMIGTFEGGTLENGVITFPVDGLAMRFPDYNGGANFKVNSDGMFRILFPDAEVTDYSLVAEYDGMKVEPDGATASAVINFTYGADVTGINYVVTAGNLTAAEAEAVAATIFDGTAENVNKISGLTDGGTITKKFALETSGMYTLVAVALDKDKKPTAKGISIINFFFPGMGGATAPDCDLEILLGAVSEYWPEMVSQYPDETSLFYEIDGSEFAALKIGLWKTDVVLGSGMTPEEIVDGYGTDASVPLTEGNPSRMDYVNERGFYGSAFINLNPGTSYTFIAKATNIYGKSSVKTATYSTKEESFDDYTGELVIGKYYMTCTPSSSTFENTFTVKPVSGSTTEYTITDLGLDNSTSWHAEYDSATSKFTVSGIEVGYETDGNLFGTIYGYWDSAKTMLFGFVSISPDNAESDGSDPCVFSVDPTTKQISAIETTFFVPVYQNNEAQTMLGSAGYFQAGTPVTYVGSANASSKLIKPSVKNVPNAGKYAVKNGKNHNRFAFSAKVSNEFKAERKIATLKVNAQACEPLQKKFGRTIKNDAASLNALK